MIIKNSLAVMSSRFSLVYKTLLYVFIILLIITAITVSILSPVLKPIIDGVNEIGLVESAKEFATCAAVGSVAEKAAAYEAFSIDLQELFDVFGSNIAVVNGALAIIIVGFLFAKFLIELSYCPTSDVMYNFMNSNSKFGFTSNFFANIKKSLAYSGVSVLVYIPYLAVSVGLLVGLWLLFVKISILLAISVCILVALFMSSFKKALLHRWLPAMVIENKNVFKALKESLVVFGKRSGALMSVYFIVALLEFCFVMVMGLFTLGLGFVFALPIALAFHRAMELVLWHQFEGCKYYTEIKDFDLKY